MKNHLAPHHVVTRFLLPLGTAAMGASIAMMGALRTAIERDNPITNELIINACTKGAFLLGVLGVGAGLSIEGYYLAQQARANRRALDRVRRSLMALTGKEFVGDEARGEIQLLLEELESEAVDE